MTKKMRDALHELCLADRDTPHGCLLIHYKTALALERRGYVFTDGFDQAVGRGWVLCFIPDREGSREGRNDVGQTHKGLLGTHG